MLDYSKQTNIKQDKSEALYLKLEQFFLRGFSNVNEDFFTTVEQAIKELNVNWTDDNVFNKLSDYIKHITANTIKTYNLGNTFQELNAKDYLLIRNGFITIGGEVSSGKTSFLTALSLDILKHNEDTAFLFYTLDDSEEFTAKRILSQILNENQLEQSFFELTEEQENILNRIVLKDKLNINLLEAEALKVKEMCKTYKIIIGIDYLQIIPAEQGMIKREYYNYIVKKLKEAQKSLEPCILFLLSQFNRDTESTTYRYRETSEIENLSDVCLDIESKMKKVKDEDTEKTKIVPDFESNIRKIKVSKNKAGKKGRKWITEINSAFNFTPLTANLADKPAEKPIEINLLNPAILGKRGKK